MSLSRELYKDVVGQKIVKIRLNSYYDKELQEWIHDPVISLSNGINLWFLTQETNGNDYGTLIVINRVNQKNRQP